MKEYKVIIEAVVREEILNIRRYIAKEMKEPITAKNIYNSINSAISSLKLLPLRYPIVEDEPHKSRAIRKMPVKNYSVFYVVDEVKNSVNILNIIYNRRNWQMLI